jgi:hypothetical protein
VGKIEFTRAIALAPPIEQELAVSGKFSYAIIAVTVADIDTPVRSKGDVGRQIKVRSVQTGSALDSDGEEKRAVM